MNVAGSLCPQCGAPPQYRERHVVRDIYIFDCKKCGYVFHAKDRRREFRSTFLTRFIRVWRRLEGDAEYLVGSLANAVGVTSELLMRLINRVEGVPLDGKPQVREVYGLALVRDERSGELKVMYRPHPAVLKDLDPEEGEPWPYDIFHVEIFGYHHSEPLANRPLSLKVQLEYCLVPPTEVFVGVEHEGRWVAFSQRKMSGEGVQELTFEIPALRKYGEVNLRVRAFHKEGEESWVEDSSIDVKLNFVEVKCEACGKTLGLSKTFPETICACGACYRVKDGRLYTLKRDEAFCYDFNAGWIYYWGHACPKCGSALNLEFSNGSWICPSCGYVELQHSYRLFRCILPCGHEDVFSIHYLTDDIPLKCRVCGVEVKLPTHVRSAWKGFNLTLLDMPVKGAVHLEYFVRKNPWVVPAALIGVPIAVGLAILGFSALLGSKGEG